MLQKKGNYFRYLHFHHFPKALIYKKSKEREKNMIISVSRLEEENII